MSQTSQTRMRRIVVLVSGGGSNLQAILDAHLDNAHVVKVISNRASAFALERAARAGVSAQVLAFKPVRDAGGTREDYERGLAQAVRDAQPDLIVLAGWMHILGPDFIASFAGTPIINLHPALPGEFDGIHAIERAFAAWQRGEIARSGCMVHHVVPAVDAGPVVALREVPFDPEDTLETYKARLHAAEHALIVDAIRTLL